MKNFIILAILFSSMIANAQQQPQYTLNQFNSNLEINPAYAGSNEKASASLRYRKQWMGYDGSPSTANFNMESKIINNALAIGLTVISDRIGITQSTIGDLSLAVHVRVSDKITTSIGFKAGVYSLNSDFSKLSNVDANDPLYVIDKRTIPYLGFGALAYTREWYVGFSAPRVVSIENISPQTRITKPHYFLYGGYRVALNDDIDLRPALLGKYVSAAPFEADIAMDAWYRNQVGVGISYRTSDAVNYMIQWRYRNLYVGYSFDMTISGMRTFNSGSHEICLGYLFGKPYLLDGSINNRHFMR